MDSSCAMDVEVGAEEVWWEDDVNAKFAKVSLNVGTGMLCTSKVQYLSRMIPCCL